MKYDMILKELKWDRIYFLVQFSSPFCKYLALKLHWSAIKVGSTLVQTILSVFPRTLQRTP